MANQHQFISELRKRLKATLAGDICSAQSLDDAQDRARVLDEVMRAVAEFMGEHVEEFII